MGETKPGQTAGSGVAGLVDRLFRRSAARLVASLTRALGADRLQLAEDAVQDALVKALQTWPYGGVPDDPEGWLFRVARNRAVDRLRRGVRWEAPVGGDDVATLQDRVHALAPSPPGPGGLTDDELAMVFMCCHPVLSPDLQVALTLRTVAGLSVAEIAAAHLAEPGAVAQRIVRAKRALREAGVALTLPGPARLPERREAVLRVLYLVFNEGYLAARDDRAVRRELCDEAIRLGEELADHPSTACPEADALVALFLLHASRLPARTDEEGGVLLLEEQDRRLWDRSRIARGMRRLERAGRGDRLTPYHLEAGIAACHAAAPSFDATDWERILGYYDVLRERAPSPVVELNRAVALSMVRGPEAGLGVLDALEPELRRYPLLAAARGAFLERAGRPGEAAVHFRRAVMLATSPPQRRFLERRAAACEARRAPG